MNDHQWRLVDLQGHQVCKNCGHLFEDGTNVPPCRPVFHKRNISGMDIAACGVRGVELRFAHHGELARVTCPECRRRIEKNQTKVRANFAAVQKAKV